MADLADLRRQMDELIAHPPVNRPPVQELARRVRQRRHRRWAGALVVVVLVGAGGTAGLIAVRSDDEPERVAASDGSTATGDWIPMAKAPIAGRAGAATLWTGKEMLVWGGVTRGSVIREAKDGAAYDPSTNTWRKIPPAPPGMAGPVDGGAVWTGDQAVFWAGNVEDELAVGGVYDPATDTWKRLPDGPLGPRDGYASVWTGREMIIIGGGFGDMLASPVAAAVDPVTGAWRALPAIDELRALAMMGAAWVDGQVVALGTQYLCEVPSSICHDTRETLFSYDPTTDERREIDLVGATQVSGQAEHLMLVAAVGTEVLFSTTNPSRHLIAYDLRTGKWSAKSPPPCAGGGPYILGSNWSGERYFAPCGDTGLLMYDPASDTWDRREVGEFPLTNRYGSAIVWTGRELIVWSGGLEDEVGNPTTDDGAVLTLR